MSAATLFRADARRAPGRIVAIGVTFVISAVILSVVTVLMTQLLSFQPAPGRLTATAADVVVETLGDSGSSFGMSDDQVRRVEAAVGGKGSVIRWQDRWFSAVVQGQAVPTPDGLATRVVSTDVLAASGIGCAGTLPGRGQVAVSREFAGALGIQIGQALTTSSAGGIKDRTVSCLAELDDATAIQFAVSPDELAAEPGSPAPTALLVYPQPGVAAADVTAALRAADLGGLDRRPAKDFAVQGRSHAVQNLALATVNMLCLNGSFVLIAACVVLSIVISLWARQRFADLTVLRALGTSRHRIRGIVIGDLLRICLPLALIALPLGWVTSQVCGRLLADAKLAPAFLPHVGLTPAVVAALAITAAAIVALSIGVGLNSAIAAGRLEPASLLREGNTMAVSGKQWGRVIAAGALAALTVPMFILLVTKPEMIVPAAAPALSIFLVPALSLVAPWLVRPLAWLWAQVARLDRGAGWLAGHNIRFNRVRTAALFGPALLAVGLATVLLNSTASLDRMNSDQYRTSSKAQQISLPAGSALLPVETAAMGGGELATYAHYAPPADGTVIPDTLLVAGVDPEKFGRATDLDFAGAPGFAVVKDHDVVMSRARLAAFDLHEGDEVSLTFADGRPEKVRIVGTYARGAGRADVYTTTELATRHSVDPGVSGVYDPTAPVATAAVVDVATVAKSMTRNRADVAALMGIALLIACYPIVAMATTAALAQTDQARQHATVRMVSGSRWQLLRQICWESGGAGLLGAVVGFGFAWLVLLPAARMAGLAAPPLDPVWTPTVAVVTVLAAVVPAWLAARPLRPIQEVAASR